MSLSQKLVKIDELAEALDRSEDWIRRNWLRLHNEMGMPRKLTLGWSWPRGALERWLEAGADGVAREVELEPADKPKAPIDVVVANQNERLRGRYARMPA